MVEATEQIYKFHIDTIKGFLEVPRSELEQLNILDKISPCSYQHEGMVYLEEDSDMNLFMDTKEQDGSLVQYRIHKDENMYKTILKYDNFSVEPISKQHKF